MGIDAQIFTSIGGKLKAFRRCAFPTLPYRDPVDHAIRRVIKPSTFNIAVSRICFHGKIKHGADIIAL